MHFDHVGINVADLPAMTEWYAAALGLEVEFEFALEQFEFSGAMLRSAGRLSDRAAAPGRERARHPGRSDPSTRR